MIKRGLHVRMAITLPLCVLVFAALPMAADGSFKSDRILVRFAPGAVSFPSGVSSADLSAVTFSPAALQDSLEAAGVETLDLVCESWRGLPAGSDLLPFDDIYALEVSGGAESVAETVETLPQIEDVSLSHYYTTMFQPNDPLYSQQWHLENDHLIWTDGFGEPQATLPDVDLDMEDAWDILQGVNDVPVFVIDTPVASHPDLQGVASPSGVSGNCGPIAWSGSHVHGTAVAGIIAARCNNSTGVAGINCAPSPSNVIVTINAGSPDVEAELAVCGLEYAATNAARVINNSWGAFDLDDFCMAAAVRNAYLSGSLVVCAAGNKNVPGRNDPVYPAEYKTTMSVGAITHTGVPWWNAVHRPSMDLAAPGGRNSISTTWVSGGTPQYTDMMSGTSAAAPMVSGVAALLVGVESSLTNDDLRYVLNRTARDIPPAGRDNLSGAGLVSAWRALRFVSDSSRVFGQALLSSSSVAVTDTSDVYLKLFKHLGWCFGDSSLPDSWTSFPVRRLTLEGIATFGAPYLSDHRNVWVRRESAFSPGWPDVDSLDCVQETGCGDVVESSWSSTSAVLRSYTYEVLSPADSSFLGFFPVHPDSVSMPYSYVLGDFDDAPTAQVVSPNGGEVYIAGSHSIEWVASDDDGVDSVSVYWSIDDGLSYPYELTTGQPNDSSWTWVVANEDTSSEYSRVAIVVGDAMGDGAFDESDEVFRAQGITGEGEVPGALLQPSGRVRSGPDRAGRVDAARSLVFLVDRPTSVKIALYDVRGRRVRSLIDQRVPAGVFNVPWDGRSDRGERLPSGVYFYRYESDQEQRTGKLVLIR